MGNNDVQLLQEALRKQRVEVSTSPKAARALLKELGLLTRSGKLKQSVTPPSASHVSR
jgi:hypothetical protein